MKVSVTMTFSPIFFTPQIYAHPPPGISLCTPLHSSLLTITSYLIFFNKSAIIDAILYYILSAKLNNEIKFLIITISKIVSHFA